MTTKDLFEYVKLKDIPYGLTFTKAYRDKSTEFENDFLYVFTHIETNTHYLFISLKRIFSIAKISGKEQEYKIRNFVKFCLLKPSKVNMVIFAMLDSIYNKPKFAIKLFKGNNTYIQMITLKGRCSIQKVPEISEAKTLETIQKYCYTLYLDTIGHPDTILRLLEMERGEEYCMV